jgi:hypothetical protein
MQRAKGTSDIRAVRVSGADAPMQLASTPQRLSRNVSIT